MQGSYRQKCKFTSLLPEAVCCYGVAVYQVLFAEKLAQECYKH